MDIEHATQDAATVVIVDNENQSNTQTQQQVRGNYTILCKFH